MIFLRTQVKILSRQTTPLSTPVVTPHAAELFKVLRVHDIISNKFVEYCADFVVLDNILRTLGSVAGRAAALS